MKFSLTIIALILHTTFLGQSMDTVTNKNYKNNVFLELYGLGYGYSLNYERLYPFKNKVITATSRAGFSYVNLKAPLFHIEYLTTPVSTSLLFGKKDNRIEFGIGMSYIHFPNHKTNNNDNDEFLNTIIIGYRLQPLVKHVNIRINYSPLYHYSVSGKIYGWGQMGSFSFGYTF